jgi:hypothetical protein
MRKSRANISFINTVPERCFVEYIFGEHVPYSNGLQEKAQDIGKETALLLWLNKISILEKELRVCPI